MDYTLARFRYGPTIQTVALYPGIPIEELINILSTILPVVGKIVGLQDENGSVVPLSLACKLPNLLSESLFVILVADSSSSSSSSTNINTNNNNNNSTTSIPLTNLRIERETSENVSPSAPPLISSLQNNNNNNNNNIIESNNSNLISNELSLGAPPPPLQPSMDPEFDNVLSADDNAELADNTLDELLRFITGLRVKKVIQKEESDILEELLFNNSSLIFAAYSVAKSASDAQYLTAVCKDIAQSMVTSAGQSACAAQEDVLHCCDELYINNKITENQLLYLRHLVLIRDEDVAQMYDDYQENSDLDRLMIGLFRLANSQPKIAEETSAVANNSNNNNSNNNNNNKQIEIQQSIKKQQDEITNNYKQQRQLQQQQQQQQKLVLETPSDNIESNTKQSKKLRNKKENPYGRKNSSSQDNNNNNNASTNLLNKEKEKEKTVKVNSSNIQTSTSESQLKETNRTKDNNEKTIMLNTLNGIIALMIRTGDINSIEAVMLNHMITNENEFILAAYELFQSDGNLVELQDTLMRCAKIELKRRGLNQERSEKQISSKNNTQNKTTSQRKKQVQQQQQQQQQKKQNQKVSNKNNNNRDVSEADDENSPNNYDDDEEDDDDDNNESDDNYKNQQLNRNKLNDLELDDIPSEPFQTTESPSQLTRLLSSLNITNIWQNTVPNKFLFVVFSATQQRLLTLGQGRALCDLYQAQYDLVRAAWEVFNVQNDIYDFIDTLKRIVRDLNFQDNGNVNLSIDRDNYDEPSETQSEDDYQLPSQNKKNNNNNNNNNNILDVMKQTEDKAKEAREAKSNALAAVEEAKRELLKHSLEIMVKQGLVTTVAASNLYERALKGDPLTDAAIEGYAGDRNIMEFLDTLQILANNTPEDLEKMLRSAMNEENNNNDNNNQDEDEEDDEEDDDEEEDGNNNNDFEYQDENDDQDLEYEENQNETNDDEEEDDEDDNNNDNLDEVQIELKKFAKELYKQGELNEENYASLLKLILVNDDRVLAAHDVYRDLQDKDDLSDSLIRISRKSAFQRQPSDDGIEMSNIQKTKQEEDSNEVEMTHLKVNSRTKRNVEETGVELSNMQNKKTQEEIPTERPQSPPGLLNSEDQKSILVILTNAGVITDNQANQIITLINNGSREIQLIFKQYEKNKDVYTLIESLRLASSEAEEVEEEQDVDNDNDDDYEDDNEEEEESNNLQGDEGDIDSTERVGEVDPDYEDYENDESGLDEDEKESIETKFLNIIQGMNLSHLETAALRLAIARDDPTIRHALETFRVNRNENILMDTLRNVARQTINDTLTEAGYDGIDEDENNNTNLSTSQNNDDNDDQDDDNDNEDDEENNDDNEDDDEEEDDDDDDDEQNTNGLISKSARQHIFPILINELLKENVLSANETKKLLELFEQDDDVVHAALDVYDLDSDLSELVDTLQRIVKTSSN